MREMLTSYKVYTLKAEHLAQVDAGAKKKYELFVKLFRLVWESEQKAMVNDPAEIQAIYTSNAT